LLLPQRGLPIDHYGHRRWGGQAGGGGAGTGMDEGFSQEPPASGMRSAPRGRPASAPKAAASMNDGITDDDVPF